jgi:hypothetical protein
MSASIVDFKKALAVLAENRVEFILIGGVAAVLHGAARATGRPFTAPR